MLVWSRLGLEHRAKSVQRFLRRAMRPKKPIAKCSDSYLSHFAIALIAALGLTACVSYDNDRDHAGQSISIPYDPYDFDPDDLLAEARRYCEAYNLRAVYIDETIDPQSVRWRYRHYDCI